MLSPTNTSRAHHNASHSISIVYIQSQTEIFLVHAEMDLLMTGCGDVQTSKLTALFFIEKFDSLK